MLNRIPIAFFQICAIVLFIIYLGMVPISKFLLTTDIYIQIIFKIIFILLNPIVFLGYYKVSQEQDKKMLSFSSVLLAIAFFVYYFYNNFVISTFGSEIMLRDPLFVISNTILGLSTIYFSIILFISKTINNRNLIAYAVFSLLTGIILCSYYFTELVFFARWVFFAMTAVYLFPRTKEGVLLSK
jgi:hypothetical protein